MRTKKGLLPKAVRKSLITFNTTSCSQLVGTEANYSELVMGDKKMEATYTCPYTCSKEKYVRRRKNTKMKELVGSSGFELFSERVDLFAHNFPRSYIHHQS